MNDVSCRGAGKAQDHTAPSVPSNIRVSLYRRGMGFPPGDICDAATVNEAYSRQQGLDPQWWWKLEPPLRRRVSARRNFDSSLPLQDRTGLAVHELRVERPDSVAFDEPRSGSGRQRGEAGAEIAHLPVGQVHGDVRCVERLHHVSVLADGPDRWRESRPGRRSRR